MKKDILQYPVNSIRFRGKQVNRGIIISEYQRKRDLKNNKSWFFSIADQDFPTILSHQKNGVQYVPVKSIAIGEIYFLYKDQVYYKLKAMKKNTGFINFEIAVSDKNEFIEYRKGYIKAVLPEIKSLIGKFNCKRDKDIFVKNTKKGLYNSIVYESQYPPSWQVRKVLKLIGFRYIPENKKWILKGE